MGRNPIETVMGVVVLLVAGLFVFFAYETAEVAAIEGYRINATFAKIGGLKKGSDVRISGIKVGTVIDHGLDPETFEAVVALSIAADIKVPADTVAAITSEGLLGGKYVRLEPGNEKEFLAPGGDITQTQDFRSLEDQVGEIIFLATGGDEGTQ